MKRDLKNMAPGDRRFHLWWDMYQRKEGYGDARKKFLHLSDEVQKHILKITPAYVAWKNERQYRPMPSTFLNQQRWMDDIPGLADDTTEQLSVEELAYLAQLEAGIEGAE